MTARRVAVGRLWSSNDNRALLDVPPANRAAAWTCHQQTAPLRGDKDELLDGPPANRRTVNGIKFDRLQRFLCRAMAWLRYLPLLLALHLRRSGPRSSVWPVFWMAKDWHVILDRATGTLAPGPAGWLAVAS